MTTDTVLAQKQIDQLEAVTLTAHAQYIGAGEVHIEGANEFARAIEQAVLQSEQVQAWKKDAERLDWLADPNNSIGNVQLPTGCVTENLHSLRAAIDDAMEKQT